MKNRDYNTDILRILACLFVVCIHACSQQFEAYDIQSIEWFSFNMYESFVRCAVPLFFMMSGQLFLCKTEELSIKTIFQKSILRILILYLVWLIIYALLSTYQYTTTHPEAQINLELFLKYINYRKYHLWYLPMLIKVYAIFPLLWIIIHHDNNKKYELYLCLIFIVLFIIQPTFEELFHQRSTISNNYIPYFGYALLGHYLYTIKDQINIKKRTLLAIYLSQVCIVTYACHSYSTSVGHTTTFMYGNFMLPTCIEAICIYLFCNKLQFNIQNIKIQNIMKTISRGTLGIYLLHPFVIDMLSNYFSIHSCTFMPLIFIPFYILFVAIISLIIGYCLNKIPYIGKWII